MLIYNGQGCLGAGVHCLRAWTSEPAEAYATTYKRANFVFRYVSDAILSPVQVHI